MNRVDEHAPDDDDRDRELAAILDELTEARRRGGEPDIEGAGARHPRLAAEIRELWDMAQIAEEAASAVDTTLGAGADRTPAAAGALPRAFGDYQLVAELGRGGMGVVYRAVQTSLGRQVALKTILRGEQASAADLARFRAEAESAAKLEHPAILPVHEIGEALGLVYFTMRLAPGGSLAKRLAEGPLPPREAARVVAAVARAIEHAHQNGVLHRDLKPSNILFDDDGKPYVADFGLARRLHQGADLTASHTLLGTPGYMAPEQAAGQRGRLSAATDVWGLGAVLYHALTGRPPFAGATPMETVLRVLEEEPLPPHMLVPSLDRDLEMIALKCLQKPPELRYASAGAVAADLEAWLGSEPIAARTGCFRDVLARVLRETHHAPVLEHWGLLWMWHGGVILALCLLTFWLQRQPVASRLPYLAIWGGGFGAWAAVFWLLRRRAGPVTFVERVVAHFWGSSVFGCFLLLLVELILGLPVLSLSPVIAVLSAGVFLHKAAILSGRFYIHAGALYLTALPMALWPGIALPLFGLVAGATFFVPGLAAWRRAR